MNDVFVGTYTINNALRKFYFNDGKLYYVNSYEKTMYCSYLQFKNDKVYALFENKKWDNGFFVILNTKNNSVKKTSSFGINPCYVSVGKYIYICNYSSENICIFDNDNLKYNLYLKNSLPHSAIEYKNNLIVVDKNNKLLVIDSKNNIKTIFNFEKHTAPRHIVIDNDFFYIVSEFSNQLFIFKDFKLINVIKISNGIGCAIKIYKNYLFTTSRETNIISVFDIMNKAEPKLIQKISSHGKNPRDMVFFNDYLLVCNVDSNNISIFKFNKKLVFFNSYYIEKPFCISFKK